MGKQWEIRKHNGRNRPSTQNCRMELRLGTEADMEIRECALKARDSESADTRHRSTVCDIQNPVRPSLFGANLLTQRSRVTNLVRYWHVANDHSGVLSEMVSDQSCLCGYEVDVNPTYRGSLVAKRRQ